jgi:hypothetical protein
VIDPTNQRIINNRILHIIGRFKYSDIFKLTKKTIKTIKTMYQGIYNNREKVKEILIFIFYLS